MHVYIVVCQSKYDAPSVWGVYSSFEKAKSVVDSELRPKELEAWIKQAELDGKMIASWSYRDHGEFYWTY